MRSNTPRWSGFDHRRLFEPIGNIPPAEYEEGLYRDAAVGEDKALRRLSLH